MTPAPTATYRLQLRDGAGFRQALGFLPILSHYGISHLYLSPVFAARAGSSHGYDIIDPNVIDPALGGMVAFEELCHAAAQLGIGIILDIVPNHTAFSVENPWLRDVLRHGAASRYARHFDIDFSTPLLLPMLDRPFDDCAADRQVGLGREADGPVMTLDGLSVPLAPDSDLPEHLTPGLDPDTARAVHDRQPWRLVPWRLERDSVTHRRFFSVTGLVGMRVEDPAVFDNMHRLIVELVGRGLVQGLRVDHVDGLTDPTVYLRRLKAAVGDIPIWIEKILVGDETLPDWPVAGTTGYEAAQKIAQLLTDPDGHAAVLTRWRAETGDAGDFHDAVAAARDEVVRNDLAAELHQLIDLAAAAFEAGGQMHGPEALREAVFALLRAFPRYRTYLSDARSDPGDLDLWRAVRDAAAAGLRIPTTLDAVYGLVVAPQTEAARAFRTRLQQVTGAVLAKAHEDTAGFRHTAYLAANEVGGDPDRPTLSTDEVAAWIAARGPLGLTLTSSHDTKRSEDARMRLVAISHAPDAFFGLWEGANRLDAASGTDPALRWYLVQSALAIWQDGTSDTGDRLADHVVKAAREGKTVSNWVNPDAEAETALRRLAHAVADAWSEAPPDALLRLIAIGDRLSLVQLALKCVMPGIPDFYGEAIGAHFALTDPDNRRPVDAATLAQAETAGGLTGAKARLTQELLKLRREDPRFFLEASSALERREGDLVLTRRTSLRTLSVRVRDDGGDVSAGGPVLLEDDTVCAA